MPQHADTHIGERLQEVRKRRGLTQQALADASKVSLSLIRKLEQGEYGMTRLETAHKLAVALRVPTSHIMHRDDPPGGPAAEPWRPLQQAIEHPAPPLDEEPSLDAARAHLPAIRAAYFDNRLGDVSHLLGPLLREADGLGEDAEARAVRAHLLQIAGSVLTQVREYSAAETALSRALDASTDRLRAASVVTTWCWLLVRQGRLEDSRQMAARWADDMEPRVSRATQEDLAAWGWLLLQLSAACLRDNRRGEAEDAMRIARAVAVMTGRELPRGDSRLATWGPVTVAFKRAERGIVLDRPDEVLKVADSLRGGQAGAETSTEFWRHRVDVARAHTMMRQYGEAVDVLWSMHDQVPEWLAQQRSARDVMSDLISQRRTLTPQMRTLAETVGASV